MGRRAAEATCSQSMQPRSDVKASRNTKSALFHSYDLSQAFTEVLGVSSTTIPQLKANDLGLPQLKRKHNKIFTPLLGAVAGFACSLHRTPEEDRSLQRSTSARLQTVSAPPIRLNLLALLCATGLAKGPHTLGPSTCRLQSGGQHVPLSASCLVLAWAACHHTASLYLWSSGSLLPSLASR